jgi:hypothetical protein
MTNSARGCGAGEQAIFKAIGWMGGNATESDADVSAFCRVSAEAQHILASFADLSAQHAMRVPADEVQPEHTPAQGATSSTVSTVNAKNLRPNIGSIVFLLPNAVNFTAFESAISLCLSAGAVRSAPRDHLLRVAVQSPVVVASIRIGSRPDLGANLRSTED